MRIALRLALFLAVALGASAPVQAAEGGELDAVHHTANGYYLDYSPLGKVELPRMFVTRRDGAIHFDVFGSSTAAVESGLYRATVEGEGGYGEGGGNVTEVEGDLEDGGIGENSAQEEVAEATTEEILGEGIEAESPYDAVMTAVGGEILVDLSLSRHLVFIFLSIGVLSCSSCRSPANTRGESAGRRRPRARSRMSWRPSWSTSATRSRAEPGRQDGQVLAVPANGLLLHPDLQPARAPALRRDRHGQHHGHGGPGPVHVRRDPVRRHEGLLDAHPVASGDPGLPQADPDPDRDPGPADQAVRARGPLVRQHDGGAPGDPEPDRAHLHRRRDVRRRGRLGHVGPCALDDERGSTSSRSWSPLSRPTSSRSSRPSLSGWPRPSTSTTTITPRTTGSRPMTSRSRPRTARPTCTKRTSGRSGRRPRSRNHTRGDCRSGSGRTPRALALSRTTLTRTPTWNPSHSATSPPASEPASP